MGLKDASDKRHVGEEFLPRDGFGHATQSCRLAVSPIAPSFGAFIGSLERGKALE